MMSRRNLLGVAAIGLASALGLSPPTNASIRTARTMSTEEIIKRYYKAWEKKDWGPLDALLKGSP